MYSYITFKMISSFWAVKGATFGNSDYNKKPMNQTGCPNNNQPNEVTQAE